MTKRLIRAVVGNETPVQGGFPVFTFSTESFDSRRLKCLRITSGYYSPIDMFLPKDPVRREAWRFYKGVDYTTKPVKLKISKIRPYDRPLFDTTDQDTYITTMFTAALGVGLKQGCAPYVLDKIRMFAVARNAFKHVPVIMTWHCPAEFHDFTPVLQNSVMRALHDSDFEHQKELMEIYNAGERIQQENNYFFKENLKYSTEFYKNGSTKKHNFKKNKDQLGHKHHRNKKTTEQESETAAYNEPEENGDICGRGIQTTFAGWLSCMHEGDSVSLWRENRGEGDGLRLYYQVKG